MTNFSYWFAEPERGDVIVFRFPHDPKKDYIKRCIGLPGETIQFQNSQLYVNGELVEEPYLPEDLSLKIMVLYKYPKGSILCVVIIAITAPTAECGDL